MPERDLSYIINRALARSSLGALARRVLPGKARRALRSLIDFPVMRRVAADRRSLRVLLAIREPVAGSGQSAGAVWVRLRRLSAAVLLRPGTADVAVARDLMLDQPHLPPDSVLPDDARLVWDLGAHIGLASVDYAGRWPHASVVAVELESDNARLCRRNLERFGARCEVVEAAVWHSDGQVSIGNDSTESDTNAFSAGDWREAAAGATVPALSLDALLARMPDGRDVDLCKLDVEGAERRILRENAGWARRVRTLAVEVHRDYTPDDCRHDLERLGFGRIENGRADNIVVGVRV